MKIGQKIKDRRTQLGWSQRDLASKMGYTHSTVGRIETGKIDIPQSRIVQFADVLGVSVAYLMGWEEVQKKNDALADIIVEMRTDEDFMSIVEAIYKMDKEKRSSLLTFLK